MVSLSRRTRRARSCSVPSFPPAHYSLSHRRPPHCNIKKPLLVNRSHHWSPLDRCRQRHPPLSHWPTFDGQRVILALSAGRHGAFPLAACAWGVYVRDVDQDWEEGTVIRTLDESLAKAGLRRATWDAHCRAARDYRAVPPELHTERSTTLLPMCPLVAIQPPAGTCEYLTMLQTSLTPVEGELGRHRGAPAPPFDNVDNEDA